MQVRGIAIKDHPGIGDVKIDFGDHAGNPASVVILAGKNGCGKTTILESLFFALAPTQYILSQPNKLAQAKYQILIEVDHFAAPFGFSSHADNEYMSKIRLDWPNFNGLIIEISNVRDVNNNFRYDYTRLWDSLTTKEWANPIQSTDLFGELPMCFLLEANVTYNVPRLQSIGIMTNDEIPRYTPGHALNYSFIRAGGELSNYISQLLVDLKAADNADVAQWLEINKEGRPPDDIKNRRIKKLTAVFSRITGKEYLYTLTTEGHHQVMFRQNNFQTSLTNLSSGEKQILFKSAYLLNNSKHLSKSIILLDEPELSLHPDWQNQILPSFIDICEITNSRKNQVIVSTHSPFVVHGTPAAKHIVMDRDENTGKIFTTLNPFYQDGNRLDVAIQAFDLGGFIKSAKGTTCALIVEGETDDQLLTIAWNKLYPNQKMSFAIIKADGAININRILRNTRDSYSIANLIKMAGLKCIGLFDFDHKGWGQWNGSVTRQESVSLAESHPCSLRKRKGADVWAALIPVPVFRASYASHELASDSRMTIELLFSDDLISHLIESVPIAGAMGCKRFAANTLAQKQKVLDGAINFPAEAFNEFVPIFDMLREIALV